MFMLHNVQCSVQLMLFLIKKIIFFFFFTSWFWSYFNHVKMPCVEIHITNKKISNNQSTGEKNKVLSYQ